MTVVEAYQNFTNSQSRAIGAADYAIESFHDSAIVTLSKDGFTEIKFNPDTNQNTEKKVTLKSAKLEHADGRLTISSSNRKINVACSWYDYQKILGYFEKLKGAENDG